MEASASREEGDTGHEEMEVPSLDLVIQSIAFLGGSLLKSLCDLVGKSPAAEELNSTGIHCTPRNKQAIHALLLCSETPLSMPCFPAGRCSLHVLFLFLPPRCSPAPLLRAGRLIPAALTPHPSPPPCSTPVTLMPPMSFCDSTLPETGRESPGVQLPGYCHSPAFPRF